MTPAQLASLDAAAIALELNVGDQLAAEVRAIAAAVRLEPVTLTAEDVAEARDLLAKCSASAILSGDHEEATHAFHDRALVYRMVCEANNLLIGAAPEAMAPVAEVARLVAALRNMRANDFPPAAPWTRGDCKTIMEAADLIERLATSAHSSGAQEPHPPSRHCGCAGCAPSFASDHGDASQ